MSRRKLAADRVSPAAERWTDEFFQDLGSRGILDTQLRDEDLDRLLASSPPISLSADFEKRARMAIVDAQGKREERSPALALGTRIARARVQLGLDLAEVAGRVGVSVRLLEALEVGRLPVRQILINFPPTKAVQLLTTIKLTVHEFASRLVELAATGGRLSTATAARTHDHQSGRDADALVVQVADYVGALKRIGPPEEPTES